MAAWEQDVSLAGDTNQILLIVIYSILYTTCDLVEYLVYIIIIWKLPNSLIGKKRELSSNSSGDEVAAKKQHDESLNDSMELDKDGVLCTKIKVSRMC